MFIAYEISRQLIVSLRPLVPGIQASDRDLADQLKRAAQSVLLNLAEGQKFEDGNRRKHYAIAQGSANEVKAALDAAEARDGSGTRRRTLARWVARGAVEAHACTGAAEAGAAQTRVRLASVGRLEIDDGNRDEEAEL